MQKVKVIKRKQPKFKPNTTQGYMMPDFAGRDTGNPFYSGLDLQGSDLGLDIEGGVSHEGLQINAGINTEGLECEL